MKKSVILMIIAALFIALIASSMVIAAQGEKAACGKGMKGMGSKMAAELNLTDNQKAQIKAIIGQYQPQFKAIRESNATPDEKRASMKELRTEMKAKINAVLTPEQQAKAKQLWQEHKGMRGKGMQAFKALNLTDAQKAQIKSIRDGSRSQIQAIKQNTNLSDADKKAQIQAIRKSTREQVMSVLTPEQRAKLQEMRAGSGCKCQK